MLFLPVLLKTELPAPRRTELGFVGTCGRVEFSEDGIEVLSKPFCSSFLKNVKNLTKKSPQSKSVRSQTPPKKSLMKALETLPWLTLNVTTSAREAALIAPAAT